MFDDQLLEGVCECGEHGPLGEVCDICGGVFSETNTKLDDFDDEDDDAYPAGAIKDDMDSDVLPLEAADEDMEDEE